MAFTRKHLLSMQDVARDEIETVFQTADSLREILSRPIKKVPPLRGKSVCTLFFEPSTRTRTSFEMAAKMLSADTQSVTMATSSVVKGESFKDTVLTLESMAFDLFVVRHRSAGAAQFLTRITDARVINAGDGMHAHPTQALLDMYTIREHRDRLAGMTIAIVGDIAHSRVARCDYHGMTTMGAVVRFVGPRTLMPAQVERMGVEVHHDLRTGLAGADVVYILRIQQERLESALLPSLREYAETFGIDRKRLALAKPDALVMHPGPMNRGVEIMPDVADGVRSLITNQVTNGLIVRMALLFLMLGGTYEEVAS
jgi:aspartate carbamoyltransferase catalytic subunit